MLADDVSCNQRNKFAGSVYANPGRHLDLYGDNIEVDYRGYEVTVENFIRVLTGTSARHNAVPSDPFVCLILLALQAGWILPSLAQNGSLQMSALTFSST